MHLIQSQMASHRAGGCTCDPGMTPQNTTAKNRPLWENELNKEFSWAYHFSTRLVSMQKKKDTRERPSYTCKHGQTHADTKQRNKQKKAMLDRWCDALCYVFMNPKWPSLHLHGLSSTGEQNAYRTLQRITLRFSIWNYHRQGPSAQGQQLQWLHRMIHYLRY